MRLDAYGRAGKHLETVGDANSDTIFNALQGIPGGPQSAIHNGSEIVRVLRPLHSAAYPLFGEYVRSMAGETITLHTAFFGAPFTTTDVFGNPYRDASKKVAVALDQPVSGGEVEKLRLTILPDSGSEIPAVGGNSECGAGPPVTTTKATTAAPVSTTHPAPAVVLHLRKFAKVRRGQVKIGTPRTRGLRWPSRCAPPAPRRPLTVPCPSVNSIHQVIEQIADMPGGAIGFRVSDEMTDADYGEVLAPALRGAAKTGEVRLLLVAAKGFDLGSFKSRFEQLRSDPELDLGHSNEWRRVGVVADGNFLIRAAFPAIAQMIPVDVKLFGIDDEAEARTWVTG